MGLPEEHVYYIHGFKSYEDLKSDIEEQLLQIPDIFFFKVRNALFLALLPVRRCEWILDQLIWD